VSLAVYCAGSSSDAARVRRFEQALRDDGALVTSTWTRHAEAWAGKDDRLPLQDAQNVARCCLNELRAATLVWFFAPSKVTTGGSFIEFGIALAELKHVIVSGPGHRQSAFFSLANETFADDESAYAYVLRSLLNESNPVRVLAQESVRPGGAR
jgi:hypothetical protein